MPFHVPLVESAIATMQREGYARDRNTDSVPRDVVLTDDQAVALLIELTRRGLRIAASGASRC
jgi:hypothetical protein